MAQYPSGIIKKDAVRPAEPYRLGAGRQEAASACGPRARIVRQDERSAVIEVTCACGGTTLLQCDYGDPVARAAAAPRPPAAGSP